MKHKLALLATLTFFLMIKVTGAIFHKQKDLELLISLSWPGNRNGTIDGGKQPSFEIRTLEKRKHKISPTEIKQIEMFIKKFIKKVGSFVTQQGFGWNEFKVLADDLGKEIVGIFNLGEMTFNEDKEIIAWANFARYCFQMMIESLKCLEIYQLKRKHSHIAESIVNINVWLLTLNNQESSEETEEYSNKLALHLTYLKFWREILKYIKEAPLSLRIMIEKQINSGELVLRGLICQVSSDDEDLCIMD